MTDPVAAVVATPLRALLRRAVPWAAAALVAGGGARLAVSEVGLVEVTREASSLRGRLEHQTTEAQRAARLELDLAVLREEARARQEELAAADRQAAALRASVDEAAAAVSSLEATRDRLAAEKAAAEGLATTRAAELDRAARQLAAVDADLSSARRELVERQRRYDEVQAIAAEQARELGRLRGTLVSTEAALEVARQHEAALEDELAAERRAAREKAAALSDLHDRVGELEARARRDAERLERLARAGVNVARLTGERPMPVVKALVVQVDPEAVPPAVVVDVGDAAGIEPGDVLVVRRDGQEVARLEVDEVRGPYSAARVVKALRGVRLRPGDQVRSP